MLDIQIENVHKVLHLTQQCLFPLPVHVLKPVLGFLPHLLFHREILKIGQNPVLLNAALNRSDQIHYE
ncbi:hypothetical protein CGSHiEE_07465 [Haemophilus influenzae PittEE]|nr:hypothetical protein CGSHiEE_07465 [Haemophilus influenzae PittEE]